MADRFSELPQYELDPAASSLLPVTTCLEKHVVPLGRRPDDPRAPVTLGMLNPADATLVAELTATLGRPVRAVQLNDFEIRRAVSRIYGLALAGEGGEIISLDASRRIVFEPGQSPSKMLEDLLSEAIRRHATDVHLETYHSDVDLRFRIDGVLRQITTPLSPDNIVRVVSRIKVLCELDLAEKRRAQDGRISALYADESGSRRVDLRVSILPGAYGEDVAIRILDPKGFILDLDRLDLPAPLLARFRRLARHPHGLLLTTGPTSSGKTTTLYAVIASLAGAALKIVTVEDPIEYEFPKVNQKHVSHQMDFADHLRAFLRSNPDVILVGEIRDSETAEIAVRAATTGHLVLSTLHTGDAIAAVGRLRNLGISNDFLSDVVAGVLGQRLVRRLCADCRVECVPPPHLLPLFFDTPPDGPFYRGEGCDACEGSGYRGLVGVFELLHPDEEVAGAIGRGVPVEELRRIARGHGWVPLAEDALDKVRQGLTSIEEVARRIAPKFPHAG